MNCIVISDDWTLSGEETMAVRLPFAASGVGESALKNTLPAFKHGFVEIVGASKQTDVYFNNCYSGTVFSSGLVKSPVSNAKSEISLISKSGIELKGTVKLFSAKEDVFICPYGVNVVTEKIAGESAFLNARIDINNLGEKIKLGVNVLIYSGNRRIAKRIKNITAFPGERTVEVPIKLNCASLYDFMETKQYRAEVALCSEGRELDSAITSFGVAKRDSVSFAGKMLGVKISEQRGLFGEVENPDFEKRLLSSLRDIGYNSIRMSGFISESMLSEADELGLRVAADIFSGWTHPSSGNSYLSFRNDYKSRIEYAVRKLRSHPSVVMYIIGDGIEESYGRSGAELTDEILRAVRSCDPSRPITAVLKELVPTLDEINECGDKIAVRIPAEKSRLSSLSRQRSVLEKMTRAFRSKLDVTGVRLPDGWQIARSDELTVAFDVPDNYYADAVIGMMKSDNICGVFAENAIGVSGDLDLTCMPSGSGYYKSVFSSAGQPVILSSNDVSDAPLNSYYPVWDYEEGQSISVKVMSSGEVASLSLNGRTIGRKVTGKINRYSADFKVEYAAGELEAVNYSNGAEAGRSVIFTTGRPRQIKLLTGAKTVKIKECGTCFVDIWILDSNGNPSMQGENELNVEVVGSGELLLAGNGKEIFSDFYSVRTFKGHALLAVKVTSTGTISVRAFGKGLLSDKISINVK